MNLQLLKAGTSDVLTLNGISKRAFDSDILVGAASPSGPPGYMSMSFHMKMARQGHLYKLTDDGSIVAPEHFRKGYGSFMMREVESLFPEVKEFTLDTPVWNVRTNVFYSKLGYKEIKHDEESVFYIKYRGKSS